MKPIFRNAAIALFVTASTLSIAQTGGNGAARGDGRDPFAAGAMATPRSGTTNPPAFGQNTIGRPLPRSGHANVSPVPEPSQWALMIAGLALVGYMVGRNRKK